MRETSSKWWEKILSQTVLSHQKTLLTPDLFLDLIYQKQMGNSKAQARQSWYGSRDHTSELPENPQVCNPSIRCDIYKQGTFLIKFSHRINFVTVQHIWNITANKLINSLTKVCQLYRQANYAVQVILLDMESGSVKDKMSSPSVTIDNYSSKEHVAQIKKGIIVLKESGRGTINTLPFNKLPK